MIVRLIEDGEEEWYKQAEKRNMYPYLSLDVLEKWDEGDYYVAFVLEKDGEKIGGISFDIYDFLYRGKM
jgi:hypothetical protein